jgi:trehalose 6-phosphate phosphatase
MRATVKEVATFFPTAIISGRARPKVYEFVQLAELYYAGSHGMDIMGPADGTNGFRAQGTQVKDKMGHDVVLFQPASDYLPLIDEVCQILSESSKGIRGARVEHNRFCVTIHFRCVKEEVTLSLSDLHLD